MRDYIINLIRQRPPMVRTLQAIDMGVTVLLLLYLWLKTGSLGLVAVIWAYGYWNAVVYGTVALLSPPVKLAKYNITSKTLKERLRIVVTLPPLFSVRMWLCSKMIALAGYVGGVGIIVNVPESTAENSNAKS